MKQVLTLTLFAFMSIIHVYAQKTITKAGRNGKPYEQYQVDANGTKHGFYKRFFANGFLETDAIYYKGKEVSNKTYEYYGNVRYLMHDNTWDRSGKMLTAKHRTYIDGEVSALVQTAGLLPNGKGRWSIDNDYAEIYNNNDTTYVWKDKTKTGNVSKYVKGEQIFSKYELDTKAKLDAIWSHKWDKHSNLKHITKDSLLALHKQYNIALDSVYAGDEHNFYNDLCLMITKANDIKLKTIVIDVLDLNTIKNTENLNYLLRRIDRDLPNAEIQVSIADKSQVLLHSCKDLFKNGYISHDNPEIPETLIKLIAILDYIK